MTRLIIVSIMTFVFMLTGCNHSEQAEDNRNLIKLNSHESTEQQVSNEVKDIVSNKQGITNVHAVHTRELIVVAFEVKHFKRFNLTSLRKKVKEDLEMKFPKQDIVVSTDKKVILELSKLEEKLESNSITEEKLNKKLKEIKKLSEEET